ncbi:OLC1v1008678C1 [Oldenlandia corymbosa var. corymbosa]|uniref:OLC1v1008678C1 n=1 Tax=Oldenlandia corymbosa var. corymbosa TaxID=529605 RepID=A0AAV1DQI2_OLDCO|nr:OLC1v1008678C1 [Oldenlandia corymbosa var. corymbosa]
MMLCSENLMVILGCWMIFLMIVSVDQLKCEGTVGGKDFINIGNHLSLFAIEPGGMRNHFLKDFVNDLTACIEDDGGNSVEILGDDLLVIDELVECADDYDVSLKNLTDEVVKLHVASEIVMYESVENYDGTEIDWLGSDFSKIRAPTFELIGMSWFIQIVGSPKTWSETITGFKGCSVERVRKSQLLAMNIPHLFD